MNYEQISKNITGRIAIAEDEAALLFDTLIEGDLYLEVGCLWGGTAILAAQRARKVITIDFMRGGFWDKIDPVTRLKPTAGKLLENFAAFGVAHRISVVKATSQPWPLPPTVRPDVFLVDGGHSFQCASWDWGIARNITNRAILVHDYHDDNKHRGVKQMVEEIALHDGDWRMVEHVNSMALFTREMPEPLETYTFEEALLTE